MGIDQGTSGSCALVIDDNGRVCGYAYQPIARLYPRPDRVEQDPIAVAEASKRPLANAITWQDLRTLPILDELKSWPAAHEARYRLGCAPGPHMTGLHLA